MKMDMKQKALCHMYMYEKALYIDIKSGGLLCYLLTNNSISQLVNMVDPVWWPRGLTPPDTTGGLEFS